MASPEGIVNNFALIVICIAIITALIGGVVFWAKLMLYRFALKKTVDDYLPEETRKRIIDKLIEKFPSKNDK